MHTHGLNKTTGRPLSSDQLITSAAELTTLWRYANVFIIIIITRLCRNQLQYLLVVQYSQPQCGDTVDGWQS